LGGKSSPLFLAFSASSQVPILAKVLLILFRLSFHQFDYNGKAAGEIVSAKFTENGIRIG
jgi:hypothetical protein